MIAQWQDQVYWCVLVITLALVGFFIFVIRLVKRASKRKKTTFDALMLLAVCIIGLGAFKLAYNIDAKIRETKRIARNVKARGGTSSRKIQSTSETNFMYAVVGETWKILDNNIGVMKRPETTSDRTEFVRNLTTMIGSGTTVEVMRTKGFMSQWKYCRVKGRYYGWILAETVGKARKIR